MLTPVEQRDFDSVFNPKPIAINVFVIGRFADRFETIGTMFYLAMAVSVGVGVVYLAHGKVRLGGTILLGVATALVCLALCLRMCVSESKALQRAAYARARLEAWFEERIGVIKSVDRVFIRDPAELGRELERYKSAIFSKLTSCEDENAPSVERQMAAACAQGTFREALMWWYRKCLYTKTVT